VLVAAVLAVAVAAPAVAITTNIVSFEESPRVSPPEQRLFSELVAEGAPPQMDPQVVPFSARYVTSFARGTQTVDLWVAPTRKGGFCYSFTEFTAGCRATRTVNVGNAIVTSGEIRPWLIDATTYRPSEGSPPRVAAGSILSSSPASLFAEYRDGHAVEVPVRWISPPINAGFFFLKVEDGSELSGLEALDQNGDVIARTTSPFR